MYSFAESSHFYKSKLRRRRSVDSEEPEELSSTVTFTSPFGDNRVEVYFKRSDQRQTTISCSSSDSLSKDLDFKVVCARVICRLGKLQHADTVRVSLTGWLWTPTFFKYQLPDVKFVSRLSLLDWGPPPQIPLTYPSARLDSPDDPPVCELPQTVVFRGVTGKYLERIPLWPIIVGVVFGSILLFGLIAILYCCGFFRRRQRTKEAKRKSMMAAASKRSRPSAYASDDHPANFLLERGINGKGAPSNGRYTDIYTANRMHAGSPDLLYAPGPQPPTPLPTDDLLIPNWPQEHLTEKDRLEEPPENATHVDSTDALLTETDEDRHCGKSSPSSSTGIPEWLMSEIKENEAKSKKSRSTKSNLL